VWGNSSKRDLLENYPESVREKEIIVAGNPKYPMKRISFRKSFCHAIVFLGREVYHESNIKLIELLALVASNCSIKFSIKLHPFSNKLDYEQITNKYGMLILPSDEIVLNLLTQEGFDFAVCFNTTVYYEAMYNDLLCFRYADGENENYLGLQDRFSNEKELTELIENIKNTNSNSLQEKAEALLVATVGMGINEYQKILQ
jgi:hypothetical protein